MASVSVNVIHICKGNYGGQILLDGKVVKQITSLLDDMSSGSPQRLKANSDKSFQGSIVLGLGFTMSPDEAQKLIASNLQNMNVLFPYLSGQDLNNNPTQSPNRWAINFFDWPLEEAEKYRECYAIVREKVYPERMKQNREIRKRYWWRYGEAAPALYRTITPLKRVLVLARTSKFLSLVFVPNGWVYNENIIVFSFDKFTEFSVLQSTEHLVWTQKYSSTLETRQGYRPTDCFETFPFPNLEPGTLNPELETIGETYHDTAVKSCLLARKG